MPHLPHVAAAAPPAAACAVAAAAPVATTVHFSGRPIRLVIQKLYTVHGHPDETHSRLHPIPKQRILILSPYSQRTDLQMIFQVRERFLAPNIGTRGRSR